MSAETSSAEVLVKLCENFASYMDQFISALCDVFPECPQMKEMRLKFKMKTSVPTEAMKQSGYRDLITGWHDSMGPFYARCAQKDDTIFSDGSSITLLESLNMASKWAECDADTRECIWEYMSQLNKLSQMFSVYTTIPQNMVGRIQNMANGIANKVEAGEMQLSDLNLMSLGQTVTTQVPEAELQAFASNMMSNPSALQSLCGMMGPQMFGAMGGGAGGGGAGAGEGPADGSGES